MHSLPQDEMGTVRGAVVVDLLTGRQYEVFAKTVINAAGPFSDSVRDMTDSGEPRIKASSGAHVTLPSYYGSQMAGMLVPSTQASAACLSGLEKPPGVVSALPLDKRLE